MPQLGALLEFCGRFGLAPLRFLIEGAHALDTPRAPGIVLPKALRTRTPRQRRFDSEKARQDLEAVLASQEYPPPSMTEVRQRLGYNHSHLYVRFPELCRAISTRWRAYQRAQSAEHKQRVCDQIRQVTAQVHAQGLYPTWTNVSAVLGKAGYIRSPLYRTAWLEALQALGLEPKMR